MITKSANELLDTAAFPAAAAGTAAIGAIPLAAAGKIADFYRNSVLNELRLDAMRDPFTLAGTLRRGKQGTGLFPEGWAKGNARALPALTTLWAASRLTDKDEVPSAMSQGLALAALGSAGVAADAVRRDYSAAKAYGDIAWRTSTRKILDRLARANVLRHAPHISAALAAPFILNKAYEPWKVRRDNEGGPRHSE